MIDSRRLGRDLRGMVRDMAQSPSKVDIGPERLKQAVAGLHPDLLYKMLEWQNCTNPSREAASLTSRGVRLKSGRAMRTSVLPRTTSVRWVDFGDGLRLRFADGHPAVRAFMTRVMPPGKLHEPELVGYLKRTIKHGDLVIDIGAHAGYVSCLAAALGATVMAAELQPTLIPIIQLNAALNELWTVHTLCAALGDRSGLVPTMRIDPSPGFQASVEQWDRMIFPLSSLNHDCIPCLTLDSLFPAGQGQGPSLVKVDVEGAEGLVLNGARGLIQAGNTRFVVEIHGHLIKGFGTGLADILALFDADRWTVSMLDVDGTIPLPRDRFVDPDGPIASHAHNAPVLFEPRH